MTIAIILSRNVRNNFKLGYRLVSAMNTPAKLFISYAHEDQIYYDELDGHLRGLENLGLVKVWGDRLIKPGEDWSNVLDLRIDEADIFIFLISHHFFKSDYCYRVEMTRALERYERDEAKAIPIIVDDCDWIPQPIGKLQAAYIADRAFKQKDNRNGIWTGISKKIRAQISDSENTSWLAPRGNANYGSSEYHHNLCDRNNQMRWLYKKYNQHLTERRGFPFVTVIHGETKQCHDLLIDRFKQEVVKVKVGINPVEQPWNVFDDLSEEQHQTGATSAWDNLMTTLTGRAVVTDGSSRDEVIALMSRHRQPYLIRMSVSSSEINTGPERWFEGFTNFWSSWEKIPESPGPICVLQIVHSNEGRREKTAAKRVRDWITKLDKVSRTTWTLTIPPELENVHRYEVDAWYNMYSFNERAKARLLHNIDELYGKARSIDMFTLTQALRDAICNN